MTINKSGTIAYACENISSNINFLAFVAICCNFKSYIKWWVKNITNGWRWWRY